MSWIVSVGLGLLVLPSLLSVVNPLIWAAFNTSFYEKFGTVLGYLNFLLGSDNLNYLLVCLSFIMFLIVFRWILRFTGIMK